MQDDQHFPSLADRTQQAAHFVTRHTRHVLIDQDQIGPVPDDLAGDSQVCFKHVNEVPRTLQKLACIGQKRLAVIQDKQASRVLPLLCSGHEDSPNTPLPRLKHPSEAGGSDFFTIGRLLSVQFPAMQLFFHPEIHSVRTFFYQENVSHQGQATLGDRAMKDNGISDSVPNVTQEEVVLFELEGHMYGLPFSSVREVLRSFSPAPLPNAPKIVEGLLNVRGEIIPLLNLRKRLGLPEKPLSLSEHFLIAKDATKWVALRVDRVVNIQRVPIRKATDAGRFVVNSEVISGVATTQEGLVLIHDLNRFLSPAEQRELSQAMPPAKPIGILRAKEKDKEKDAETEKAK